MAGFQKPFASPFARPMATLLQTSLSSRVIIPAQTLTEALVNPDMNWSAGALTGWTLNVGTVGGDPGFTEVKPDGSAGTGAVKFSGTATVPQLRQNGVLSIGAEYDILLDVSVRTSDSARLYDGAAILVTAASAMVVRNISRAAGTGMFLFGTAAPTSFVVNRCSMQRITINPEYTAPLADMRVEQYFTLPASPDMGTQVWVLPRISSAASGNYWLALLEYTGAQWNITLYSVASHARTSRIAATNIGATNGVRVDMNGSSISLYTTADSGGNWTQRGTTITNTTYQTATGVNARWTRDVIIGRIVITNPT